jgi:hypothetical protein
MIGCVSHPSRVKYGTMIDTCVVLGACEEEDDGVVCSACKDANEDGIFMAKRCGFA